MNDKIKGIVDEYIRGVTSDIEQHVQDEKYKFEALRHFQETFDIDSDDIAGNLKSALSKVYNLAVGASYYPVASIVEIASHEPEGTRRALKILFSDSIQDTERFANFQEIMAPLSHQFSTKTVSYPYNMDLRFMSLLASLYMPDKFMYFKPTEVDSIFKKIYGEKTGTSGNDANRIMKATELGIEIQRELVSRPEFQKISEAMGYGGEHNLWFAQDVIWHEATGNTLLRQVKQFMEDNPDWRNNSEWQLQLTQDQIDSAVADFKLKFAPAKLKELSDDEILRWMPYREVTTNDSLSYLLEFSPIIGKMGGIGGGSAGKMGYYQGKDGNWKTLTNKVTTKEDVLFHRKIDIEILSAMNGYIEANDFNGLKQYTDSLKANATDEDSNYKAVVPGLVWVRKYFSILFPDKFLKLYGSNFVVKLEGIAGIGKIHGGGKDWDYSLWYRQMNKISTIAPELNITNYELSIVIWNLVNLEDQGEEQKVEEESETVTPMISLNTIIYGPPGTGKTYSIKNYKDALLSNQTSKFANLIKGNIKEALLYLFNKYDNSPANPFDIWRSEDFQQLQEYNGRTRSNGNAIRNELVNNDLLFRRVEQEGRVQYQATEDGLEYVRTIIEAQNEQPHADKDDFYEFVTFHQSFGYEEFIEGIRAETNDSGNISYAVRDGVFKAFCRRAESDPDNKFLFVIDEINRGNISKIFGELITLIEPNKRSGASEGMTTTLPYSGEKFGVPKNVYVVGTMNTTDRSISLLDIALRRRFDFEEIMPKASLLAEDVQGINLQRLLTAVNAQLVEKIDRNHQIGHSYLMGVNSLSDLRSAWYKRIVPLLQEYFYDDDDDLRSILKTFIDVDGVAELDGEVFKDAITGIYEETQSTDSGIQL